MPIFFGISKEQFGFFEGKKITNAIGVVQEVLHNIKVKNIKALVLKLGLIKDYDRVEWGFLRLVLLQVGLNLEATDLIMGCVTLANFAVLLSGKPTNLFKSSRVLRHGCPLSPLPFLLIVEDLSRAIKEQVLTKNIEGILVAIFLFVDDIILFGFGSLQEWKVYKNILDLFCKATGMTFNPQKSSFLEVEWSTEELVDLNELFPFETKPIELGFKYMGCYLKPNCYTKSDWRWLEKKFDPRISNWSHRWLSLGGMVILVKSILESIPMYWLSLANFTKCTLNNIRRRIFSFLWTGNNLKGGVHMISCKKLYKPKKVGGLGIKNIFIFGKALEAKSLWRVLIVLGLWHEVILKKYLRKKQVKDWFREGNKNKPGISNIWGALTSSYNIVVDWLALKPGNGKGIRIGSDPMVGAHMYYSLTKNIIQSLMVHGIEYLAQEREMHQQKKEKCIRRA